MMQMVAHRPNLAQGNLVSKYHGTTLACSLHTTKQTCFLGTCNVCGILRNGFQISRVGTGPLGPFLRFGNGIYFTSVSSKAHDYSHNTTAYLGQGIRCMILCDIVAGSEERRISNNPSPPNPGFDSVLGVVAEGGVLNYEELVVFNDAAIVPKYVLIYQN